MTKLYIQKKEQFLPPNFLFWQQEDGCSKRENIFQGDSVP